MLSNPGTPVKLIGDAFSTRLDLKLDDGGCLGGNELAVDCDAEADISSSDALKFHNGNEQ